MKLNADILYDNLSSRYTVEIIGPKSTELCLSRPELLTEKLSMLSDNGLYIAKAERLPNRINIGSNVVLVCTDDSPQLSFYQVRCCVLRISGREDLFEVSNYVQQLFNQYDAWYEKLHEILDRNASVEEMLAVSRPIFENPMFVIDANFHYLAYTENALTDQPNAASDGENLSIETLGQFLELHEPSMYVREPLVLHLLDTETLNCNLFDKDTYIGCLTINCRLRAHRNSDLPLSTILAHMIERALQKFSGIMTDPRSVFRKVLQDVVDGMPVEYDQQRMVEAAQNNKSYVCVKMKVSSRFAKLPLGYICNRVETVFPGSIAFERKGDVMCFVELAHAEDQVLQAELHKQLIAFIDSMDLRIGVSDVFTDLFSARLYYHQASAALENGILINPADKYYVFQDYALAELVINSLGRLPTELFFSEGMRRLYTHDTDASVSYIETLRVYLNNNMNITKTAADLYVHRSTLLERIARIERELDADLQNPDVRLRIQLLLKAMELHEAIHDLPQAE